jgi:hypothetical protein
MESEGLVTWSTGLLRFLLNDLQVFFILTRLKCRVTWYEGNITFSTFADPWGAGFVTKNHVKHENG